MATFYEPGRTYTQAELDALIQPVGHAADISIVVSNSAGAQGLSYMITTNLTAGL